MVIFPLGCVLGTGRPLTVGETMGNRRSAFHTLILGGVLIPAFKAWLPPTYPSFVCGEAATQTLSHAFEHCL